MKRRDSARRNQRRGRSTSRGRTTSAACRNTTGQEHQQIQTLEPSKSCSRWPITMSETKITGDLPPTVEPSPPSGSKVVRSLRKKKLSQYPLLAEDWPLRSKRLFGQISFDALTTVVWIQTPKSSKSLWGSMALGSSKHRNGWSKATEPYLTLKRLTLLRIKK